LQRIKIGSIRETSLTGLQDFWFDARNLLRKNGLGELSAWESYSTLLYFQDLQNCSAKIRVHAMHIGTQCLICVSLPTFAVLFYPANRH
jgi:hypothetical protein